MVTSKLLGQLAAAEAELARIRREISGATCAEVGHNYLYSGGKNANCGFDGCSCSVPVYICSLCHDSDYGDNEEAMEIMEKCTVFES